MAQLLSRLRARFGVDFSFKDIFDAPTVAALAARIESSKRICHRDPWLARYSGGWPAACCRSSNKEFIVLSKIDRIGHKYHVVEGVRLSGPLDLDVLEASIATISERHEALRSIFLERLGEPMQTVTTVRPCLERLDLRPLPEASEPPRFDRRHMELLRQSFDIEKEPPIRAQLLRLGEHDHALVIKLHHLITDGWSQRLFWEELEALYNAGVKRAACQAA